ncbi:formimidoylglutamate deiminase [Sneathiella glossodoripedis]|uniref:formimidoylglutamate deiminase n=1 Tax=Sneathiella glossodoripedis TaxID=418853 RepID=UPI00190294E9|nr:formimidoylglutamate deiminase [Sneathiella glossodoripedis]
MTEFRSGQGNDSFWTWRKLMYAFLEHLTPEHMYAINCFVQMEMMEAGYASLGEFHYIHHQTDGSHYSNVAEMANTVTDAACQSGIGLTLLPVFYEQGGVDGRPLTDGQLRFGNTTDTYDKLWEQARNYGDSAISDFHLGIAPHSLRATSLSSLGHLVKNYTNVPVHIHIAEQIAEIEEIENAFGARPVEWLMEQTDVDSRWCLVHATHLSEFEVDALAQSGAIAGLCPVTEANLGDGIFPCVDFLSKGGAIGVGTDSNISVSFVHELRMLEYSQRLHHRQRAMLSTNNQSTGRTLFDAAITGGAQAVGRKTGKIATGYLADFISLDNAHIDLLSLENDYILDSWIFASKDELIKDVISAGRHMVKDGQHVKRNDFRQLFHKTIRELRNLI